MKLKNAVVGQRVELKASAYTPSTLNVGAIGTIVHTQDVYELKVGVQWDDFTEGHSCTGRTTTDKSGWYVPEGHIRKYKEPKIEDVPKPLEITVGSKVRRNSKDVVVGGVPIGDTGVVLAVLENTYRIDFEKYGQACLYKHKVDLVEPAKEIEVGSTVRITELRGYDEYRGVQVGDVYKVVYVQECGDVRVKLKGGRTRSMFKSQIELVG